MAHTRQSRPDSGLGFKAKVLESLKVFPLARKRSRILLRDPGLSRRGSLVAILSRGPMFERQQVTSTSSEREGEKEAHSWHYCPGWGQAMHPAGTLSGRIRKNFNGFEDSDLEAKAINWP